MEDKSPGITKPVIDAETGEIDTEIFMRKFLEKLNNDRKPKRAAVGMPKRKYNRGNVSNLHKGGLILEDIFTSLLTSS